MGRDRFKEESDFNEIISVDNDISKIKKVIGSILPKDIKVIAKNNSQKELINSVKNNEITICAGLAGTGKTYVAIAYALSLLRKTSNRYKKIYLVKSVTTLKDEELGFLKGNLKDKIEPIMWSFMINMEKLISSISINMLIEKEIICPVPLAYIRGASLDDCIIIADEMQNVTLDNSRTLLTRIGSNSKIIILGDVNQIDIKNKKDSSLETLLKLFEDTLNMGVVKMSEEDTNIRNPLISVIESKFKNYFENQKPKYNTIPKNNILHD